MPMGTARTAPDPLAGGPITRLGGTPQPTRATGRRSTSDLVVAVAVGAAASAAAVLLGPGRDLAERAVALPSGVLDGLLALAVLVPAAAFVVVRRRFREVAAVRRQLVHLSLHDTLTGLPNRRLLLDWLAADISRSQQRNTQAAVLFVDLDRFKFVNDTHGHEIGDRLMRLVAERLGTVARPGDRLVRYGGDEFVLVCPGLNGVTAAEDLARRAIAAIETPFSVGAESLRISASVGIALCEKRRIRPEDVLHDADVAMYQAKALGPGNVVAFDRSMNGRLTPASAEEHIRAALEAGEFHLHYQPVVDLATGRIVGAEALLRWISDSRGTMAPAEFVPILEETGLIVPVGAWVLEEACRQATRLRRIFEDQPPLAITVNVSARQICQAGFGEVLVSALRSSGVSPGQIHLEITEGALMHDVTSAWAVLRHAKALGVKLALDDFGTGYSSLSYVRRFSLDMLKIDKSFIDGVESSPEDRAIVEHVVAMAEALGMTTVAEGVERPEQLTWLRSIGCRLAQGYAMSRPLSADDLEALLVKRLHAPYHIDGHDQVGDGAPGDAGAHDRVLTGDVIEPFIDRPLLVDTPIPRPVVPDPIAPHPRLGRPGLPRLREYRPPPGRGERPA